MPRRKSQPIIFTGRHGEYKMNANNPFFKMKTDGRTKEGRMRKEYETAMMSLEDIAHRANTDLRTILNIVE